MLEGQVGPFLGEDVPERVHHSVVRRRPELDASFQRFRRATHLYLKSPTHGLEGQGDKKADTDAHELCRVPQNGAGFRRYRQVRSNERWEG